LTGSVFVAMSLNPGVMAQDPTHRHRVVGTISSFTAIFVICALGVMGGQDHRAVGLEWLGMSAAAAAVFYVYGYVQAIRLGESSVGLRSRRLIGGTALHLVEIVGAALLLGKYIAGLYLAAISKVGLARLHDLRRLAAHHRDLRATVERPGRILKPGFWRSCRGASALTRFALL